MSATYNSDLSTSKDKVRLYLGDTDTTAPKFQDEEINAILNVYPNPIKTALVLAESLVAKFASYHSERVGDVSVDYGSLADNYRNLVVTLKNRLSSECGNISIGGLSQAEKDSFAEDDDLVKAKFSKDLQSADIEYESD